MRSDLLWIAVLLMTRALASPLPTHSPSTPTPQPESDVHREEGEVISVRITSSVAVDRGPRNDHGIAGNTGHRVTGHGNLGHGITTYGNLDHEIMHHENKDHGIMVHGNLDHGIMHPENMDHGNTAQGNLSGILRHESTDHGIMAHGKMDHTIMTHGDTHRDKMDRGNTPHGHVDQSISGHWNADEGATGHGNSALETMDRREPHPPHISPLDVYQPAHISPPQVTLGDTYQTPLAFTATETTDPLATQLPQELAGANIEFIKQLNAKKEARGLTNVERVHPFHATSERPQESDDSAIEESVKSILEIPINNNEDLYDDVPLARSFPPGSRKNYVHDPPDKTLYEKRNGPRLTTVSFNVVHHSTPIVTPNYNEGQGYTGSFSTPQHYYSEPPQVYSQPAKVYSEPAKIYSEPSKIYSEPAKVYGEPAKVYGEPAKIYGEPAKFYSQPASLHLEPAAPTQDSTDTPASPTSSTTLSTTPTPEPNATSTERHDHQPERNYEVDEKVSVLTDGRSHGVQEGTAENCKQDNCKVGYVVEGRQYRKYRVEERTADGFLVGEYGVVRNEDGVLRGVRYTADSDASPRLIYDALMKFLQLK